MTIWLCHSIPQSILHTVAEVMLFKIKVTSSYSNTLHPSMPPHFPLNKSQSHYNSLQAHMIWSPSATPWTSCPLTRPLTHSTVATLATLLSHTCQACPLLRAFDTGYLHLPEMLFFHPRYIQSELLFLLPVSYQIILPQLVFLTTLFKVEGIAMALLIPYSPLFHPFT